MVKVGDKVVVTTDEYAPGCHAGSECVVAHVFNDGIVRAEIIGGDGYGWYLEQGEFTTPTPHKDQTDTYTKTLEILAGEELVTMARNICEVMKDAS